MKQIKLDKTTVIERIRKVHGSKYDGLNDILYTNITTKICLKCPSHGEFWITPKSLFKGCGCRQCAQEKNSGKCRHTKEQFIEKARKVHGDKYDYSKVDYVNADTKVCIICPEHGEFWQTPSKHLNRQGCPICYKAFSCKEEFIDKAKEIHEEKYDYSKVEYINKRTKVCIICPEHGEFWQLPYTHIDRNSGCPKCAIKKMSKKLTLSPDEYMKRVISLHGENYDYTNVKYSSMNEYVYPICHKTNKQGVEHGEFQILANNFLHYGCPKCTINNYSSLEKEVLDFISNEGLKIEENVRNIVKTYELDMFIPSKNIAIEFDGLYWHNEINQPNKNYHLYKTEDCNHKNISLIHIFEDEWLYKKEIVKSRLKNLLGLTENRIYARNCEIKEITNKESKTFLETNHIQGYVSAKYTYGLYYQDELVSIMSFCSLRKNLGNQKTYNEYEMLRFCNKLNTNVVGGASKLLNHFIRQIKPKRIISYADKRWSNGNLYKRLGFEHIHDSNPNYFYIVGKHRENRFKYRKSELIKQGYDPSKSEHEIMLERKIYRIYDCGTMVFEKII